MAIPFSQKLVLAIKAYLKNDVLDRPSFDQEKGVSLIFHKSMDKISTKIRWHPKINKLLGKQSLIFFSFLLDFINYC